MSKGKRKSSPGALLIVRQKLRLGTLSNEDRQTLHQVSRLDLIALIEGELGVCLTGSQKNSVAAMVTWLLGPEDDGTGAARGKSRSKKPQPCKKKSRPDNDGPKAGRATRPPASKPRQELGAAAEPAGRDSGDSWREAQPEQQQGEGGADSVGGYCAHGSTCPTHGHSSEVGQGTAAAAAAAAAAEAGDADADEDGAHWLRELQMQLAAAATAEDEADDLDCSATAQSSMQVLQGGPHQQQQQQLGLYGGQSTTPPAISDDALESHLLQQLLQDMQLSPQLQQQQQPARQPSPLLQQQVSQQLLPQEPQQLVAQQSATQPLLPPQHSATQPLLPPQQLPLQQIQQQQQPSQQQEQQQLFEHIQRQLQLPSQQQQLLQPPRQLSPEQMQQLEEDLQPSPLPGYVPYLPQAASGAITQSCPLPNAVADSWGGAMQQRSVEQGVHSFSSSLPVWQQQQQQVEMSESASMTFKKRDRQQLFQQLLQGSDPSAPLSVELSGPSADLTIKRRSMQIPGTDSFSTMATAFAGGGSFAFAGRSAQSAPPRLAPPMYPAELLEGSSSQQQQQLLLQADKQQRTGLKKGMKGLAKRFKALLGGKAGSSSSAQQQQQQAAAGLQQQQQQLRAQQHIAQPVGSFAGRVGSSASAPAAVRGDDGSMSVDLMAHIDMDYSAEGLLPPAGRQVSTASTYSGRNPSVTGSIGYYQSGPPGVGSYPSWTGISGQQAYGSMTGQGASLTLQQQRLALLQQQQRQQQSFASSFGGASAGSSAGVGGYENFGEKLKVLRAMYGSQYSSDASKPPADAAAGVGSNPAPGGMFPGPPPAVGGPLSSMEPLPALKEEVDMPAAAAAAAAAPGAAADSSRQQFMQKLSKAFGLGSKQQQQYDDETAAVLGSGLSLTERSNSSFSLFLARVASGWRHDSSSTAAATFHEDSYPPLAVGRSSFSHTTSVNPSLPSTGTESSSSAAANAAAVVAAMAAANAAAAAAGSSSHTAGVTAAAAVETSRGSFSRAYGVQRPSIPSGAAAAAAAAAGHQLDASTSAVEPSGRSFSKLFGSCAGGDSHHAGRVEQSRGSFSKLFGSCAGGESHHAGGVEQSRGSFSKLFGPCFDTGGQLNTAAAAGAAAGAAAAAANTVEPSRSSFSRLLGASRADSCGPAGAAASAGMAMHGVEQSRGSFSKLFGPCTSAQGMPGVEHSRGSFSRLLGACAGAGNNATANAAAAACGGVAASAPQNVSGVEHSRGSFSKLLAPFGSCAGCDTSNAADAAAAAAGVVPDSGVERSSRSFSKLLGPCAGGEFNAAALVEGSSRSFTKLFSSCSGCTGDASVAGGQNSAEAAPADQAAASGAGAGAAAAAGQAGMPSMGPYKQQQQQQTWMQQVPPAGLNLQQQQHYMQQVQLQLPDQQQQQLCAQSHAQLLLPAVPEIAVDEAQAAYSADPAASMLDDAALQRDPADSPSLELLQMDEGI